MGPSHCVTGSLYQEEDDRRFLGSALKILLTGSGGVLLNLKVNRHFGSLVNVDGRIWQAHRRFCSGLCLYTSQSQRVPYHTTITQITQKLQEKKTLTP
jgi:hypothetical protein